MNPRERPARGGPADRRSRAPLEDRPAARRGPRRPDGGLGPRAEVRAGTLAVTLELDPSAALARLAHADLIRPDRPTSRSHTSSCRRPRTGRCSGGGGAGSTLVPPPRSRRSRARERAAIMGRHHAGAGNSEEALRWFRIAAGRAEEVSALLEAIEDLDEAIRIGSPKRWRSCDCGGAAFAGGPVTIGAPAPIWTSRCAPRSNGATGRSRCGATTSRLPRRGRCGLPRSVEHLERALALADELGDAAGRVSALAAHDHVGEPRTARPGERIRGARAGDGVGHRRRTSARRRAGRAQARRVAPGPNLDVERYGDELRRMYARRNDRWLEQFVDLETAYASIAGCRFDEARRRLERGLTTNRELHDDGNEPLFVGTFCPYYRCRGELDEAVGSRAPRARPRPGARACGMDRFDSVAAGSHVAAGRRQG